jgi:ABC-type enterobactin transport system permease subunit
MFDVDSSSTVSLAFCSGPRVVVSIVAGGAAIIESVNSFEVCSGDIIGAKVGEAVFVIVTLFVEGGGVVAVIVVIVVGCGGVVAVVVVDGVLAVRPPNWVYSVAYSSNIFGRFMLLFVIVGIRATFCFWRSESY